MAWKYYIKTEEKDGNFYFELWYVGKQPMGYSKPYDTYANCLKGVNEFKNYLNNINPSFENGLITISYYTDVNGVKMYSYKFLDDANNVLYESGKLISKINCIKSAKSTCSAFVDADIKND